MNEVTTTQTDTGLAIHTGSNAMFGFEQVTTKDIKIPLIYVAQAMSKVVGDGAATPGAIVDNLTGKTLGNMKSPAKVVPFYFQKSYVVQKLVNGKKEFAANEPYDSEREYEVVKDGVTYFNLPCFNFFVLVYGDESATRYVLSFRGSRNITSGGRPMISQLMNKYQTQKAAPYNFVFDIGVKQVENEKGKWFVLTSQGAKDSSGKELLTDASTKAYAMKAAADIQNMFAGGSQLDLSEVPEEHDGSVADNGGKEAKF